MKNSRKRKWHEILQGLEILHMLSNPVHPYVFVAQKKKLERKGRLGWHLQPNGQTNCNCKANRNSGVSTLLAARVFWTTQGAVQALVAIN